MRKKGEKVLVCYNPLRKGNESHQLLAKELTTKGNVGVLF